MANRARYSTFPEPLPLFAAPPRIGEDGGEARGGEGLDVLGAKGGVRGEGDAHGFVGEGDEVAELLQRGGHGHDIRYTYRKCQKLLFFIIPNYDETGAQQNHSGSPGSRG